MYGSVTINVNSIPEGFVVMLGLMLLWLSQYFRFQDPHSRIYLRSFQVGVLVWLSQMVLQMMARNTANVDHLLISRVNLWLAFLFVPATCIFTDGLREGRRKLEPFAWALFVVAGVVYLPDLGWIHFHHPDGRIGFGPLFVPAFLALVSSISVQSYWLWHARQDTWLKPRQLVLVLSLALFTGAFDVGYSIITKTMFQVATFWLGGLVFMTWGYASLVRYQHSLFEALMRTQHERNHLETQLNQDALTGAVSRSRGIELLESWAGQREVSVVFVDVDDFKFWNDTYGHRYGDEVLCRIAQVMRDHVSAGDVVVRYAGDEFLVLLPDTGAEGARQVAQRLLRQVSQIGRDDQRVGVSMGVAMARLGEPTTANALLEKADRQVYRAKAEGKNRIVVDDALLFELAMSNH